MNDAILVELATRWEFEAKAPKRADRSESAKMANALAEGERQGLRRCANTFRAIVDMLGDEHVNRGLRVTQTLPERG